MNPRRTIDVTVGFCSTQNHQMLIRMIRIRTAFRVYTTEQLGRVHIPTHKVCIVREERANCTDTPIFSTSAW